MSKMGNVIGNRKSSKKELHVGNFKVLMTSVTNVPIIEVSNLEGTWKVRVPVDFQMYGILNRLLLEYIGDNEEQKRNAEDWLKMFFMNWQNATGIPNGYYQQALLFISGCYADPSLLKTSFFGKGKGNDFMKDVKKLRKDFLKWAKERDRLTSEAENEIDMEKEAVADQAMGALNGEV